MVQQLCEGQQDVKSSSNDVEDSRIGFFRGSGGASVVEGAGDEAHRGGHCGTAGVVADEGRVQDGKQECRKVEDVHGSLVNQEFPEQFRGDDIGELLASRQGKGERNTRWAGELLYKERNRGEAPEEGEGTEGENNGDGDDEAQA